MLEKKYKMLITSIFSLFQHCFPIFQTLLTSDLKVRITCPCNICCPFVIKNIFEVLYLNILHLNILYLNIFEGTFLALNFWLLSFCFSFLWTTQSCINN